MTNRVLIHDLKKHIVKEIVIAGWVDIRRDQGKLVGRHPGKIIHKEKDTAVVLSAGTDGLDGNSPAAGAVASGETCARAGLDARGFYQRSDSYSFFAALGDAIVTGPTGNNVRDLRLLVKY